jgi:hypothetical protein
MGDRQTFARQPPTKAVVISVPPTVGDVGAFGSTDVTHA